MSLRRRIAFTAATAVAVAVVLGSLAAYFVVRDTLRQQIDRSLTAGTTFSVALPPGARPEVQPLEGPVVYRQTIVGDRVFAPGPGPADRLGDPDKIKAVAAGKEPPFFGDTKVNGAHVRYFTTRGPDGAAVQVARPMGEVDTALYRLRLGLGLLAVAGIALAVFLSRLATRHAVRPVAELTETAEHVARTRDLSRRIDAEGDDELARLAGSFNTMLEALDASQRAQRQLVADASHELRTPLTSLRTNLEVLGSNGKLEAADRERLRVTSSPSSRSSASWSATSSSSRATARRRRAVGARAARRARGRGRRARAAACARGGVRGRARVLRGRRRARAARSRGGEPARQRGQVEPARQHGRGATRRRRADRSRPRAGDRARGPPARVRPLLPRDGGTRPGRLGTRAGDRAARRRAARRDRRAEEAPGGGALLRLALPVSHPIPI